MTAAVILAAGESSRLGFPKQTQLFRGKTLVERAIEAGLQSTCRPVIVVLGANVDAIEPGIRPYGITILLNADWREGMASSIRTAIGHVQQLSDIDGVVLMLCDQPFADADLIDLLVATSGQTNCPIVASAYQDIIGVPVLFKRALFAELLLLKGQAGAKKILALHSGEMITVPFDKGGIDIDTLADYESLLKKD